MARQRPQLKVGEVIKFLSELPKNTPIFLGPSIVNLDEPSKTQEFIDWAINEKCVAIEYCAGSPEKGVTLGWAA